MIEQKGRIKRVVKVPGFHLSSKYDLSKTRERLTALESKRKQPGLNLAPMIDIFSMLVIFLLLNFSSTGEIFFISKDLSLPQASHARKLEGLPLLSITQNSIIFEAKNVGKNPVYIEDKQAELPQLRLKLQQIKVLHETIFPDKPFKGEVNIQADESIPLIYVKRVMNVLINEGWTGINFAVIPSSS